MSEVQVLRSFVHQRLSAAAAEIFDVFERTIAEYEEQLRLSKEEKGKQQKLLEAVFNPEVRLQRLDVQQLLVKEVPHEQQEASSRPNQEISEPLHMKEDQEELWGSQDGLQPLELKEALIKSEITPVIMKSEDDDDDEEKPSFSPPYETQTEANRETEHLEAEADVEDCEGPEPDRDSNTNILVQAVTADKASQSDSDDSNSLCDWEETFKKLSIFNPLQNKAGEVNGAICGSGNVSLCSEDHAASCCQIGPQQSKRLKNREKTISCSICGKRYLRKAFLKRHLKDHSEEHRYNCSICDKGYNRKGMLEAHMKKVHKEERPSHCSVNNAEIFIESKLTAKSNTLTGGKLYPCKVCKMSFSHMKDLFDHTGIHNGKKKPCSVCGKNIDRYSLTRHMRIHTGEKRVTCSACGKRFAEYDDFKRHSTTHKEERPYCCSVCGKTFKQKQHYNAHLTTQNHIVVRYVEKVLHQDVR